VNCRTLYPLAKGIREYFANGVVGAVHISIDVPPIRRSIEPALHALPTERRDLRCAIARQWVGVEKAGLAGVALFNGLLTNDKFCLTRPVRLHLSWSRYEVWQRRMAPPVQRLPCPLGESTRCGGQDETSMASSPVARRISRRATALGSGLPERSGMEPTAGAAPAGSGRPGSARRSGGGSCA
jgi:hypothetical protein